MIRPALATALIWLSVAPLLAQSQPPSPGRANTSQEQQQQAEAKQGGASEAPQASAAAVPPQEPIEAPPAQQPAGSASDQNQQSTLDWWLTVASGLSNVVIALFTVVLAVVALWQMSYMRAGLVETCKAAEAAQKSADTSQKMLMAQRAFVMVKEFQVGMVKPDDGGAPVAWYVSHVYENSGSSPAIQVGVRIGVCRRPSTEASHPTLSQEERRQRVSTVSVGVGGTVASVQMRITPDDASKLKAGQMRIFIHGHVTYLALGELKFTDTCHELKATGDSIKPREGTHPFSFVAGPPEHNDSD